ncbi:hypothetical protein AU184_02030 [Mycolicibacterium novocastrense]|uniref:DUF2889 domain-containing protein n=1 Tax=Mycolicibacterium novocastrense TaxID=59813 RepID=UPI0007471CE4|nr:DUF2889 domain-containing protein [Mycolicibacterium novocastrense]KUH64313.1 hypothetical protein AU072_01970 [Mycolicibacterium novocastrense]KUH65184.1 hypothetical protein AU184_02030 [Mycolicibacterium novocastrense]KUH76224.1 hypothetical protein AU183_26020 [Mycolicibacterium novocastrense]
MPFVTDIVGPQRPVTTWPPLEAGALRRTSTIDTHPDGAADSDVDLRARDVVRRGEVDVLDEIAVRAHLADRTIEKIAAVPGDDRLDHLIGERVGPGFRSTVGELLGEEVRRSSLLHLLLDDWVGAALVSGYALQHAAIVAGAEEKLPPGTADRMASICAGFAPEASLVGYARRLGTIPSVHGPEAPPIDTDGMHAVEPLRAHGMRRLRRLDLLAPERGSARFDAHFRDSHVDGDGIETIVHEYTITGAVDEATRTITAISADVRVLPWQECPGAIGSAQRAQGMRLVEVRDRVRAEFVGTSTCTHLNDTLRAIGDLEALFELRSGLDDV